MRDAAQGPACCAGGDFSRRRWARTRRLYAAARRVAPRQMRRIDREYLRVATEGFGDAGVGLPSPERRVRAKPDSGPCLNALREQFDEQIRRGQRAGGVPASKSWPARAPAVCRRDISRATTTGRVLSSGALDLYCDLPAGAGARRRRGGARAHLPRQVSNARRRRQPAEAARGESRSCAASTRRCPGFTSFADTSCAAAWPSTPPTRSASSTRSSAVLTDNAASAASRQLREGRRRGQRRSRSSRRAWSAGMSPTDTDARAARESYAVDQEAFRPYFPPQARSLRFVMKRGRDAARRALRAVAARGLASRGVQAYAVSATRAAASRCDRALAMSTSYPRRDGKWQPTWRSAGLSQRL